MQEGPGAEEKDGTHSPGADGSRERSRSGKGGEQGGAGRRGEANTHTARHPLRLRAVTVARSPGTVSRPLPPAARARSPQPFLAAAGPGRQLRQPHARREQEQDGAR